MTAQFPHCRRLAKNLAFCLPQPRFGPLLPIPKHCAAYRWVSGYLVHRGTSTETLARVPQSEMLQVCFLVLLQRFFHMREKLEQRVIECSRVFELHSMGSIGDFGLTARRHASM